MPTYDIAGVAVDFPFEAYRVQKVYMEKVVLALQDGSNALLESPTGTGKTLCLLCAALGWRRAQLERMRAAAGVNACAGSDGGWVAAEAARAALSGSNSGASGGVAGASAEGGRVARIIYASRTHSQLGQVVRELKRTVHRPLVCMLGSREQLCCHPEVSRLTGAAQAAGCQALTAQSSCSFYRTLQEKKQKNGGHKVLLPHPQAHLPEASRPIPDIEDFVATSRRDAICPFFYARELQASADVLFLPYNYLVDPKTRRALNINLASDVIIFDEAHNIERVCADAASYDLTSLDLAGAARELDRLIHGARNGGGDEDDLGGDDESDQMRDENGYGGKRRESEAGGGRGAELMRVKQIVLEVDQRLEQMPLAKGRGDPRYVSSGDGLRSLLAAAGIEAHNYHLLVEQFEKGVARLGENAKFGVTSGGTMHLQKLADLLRVAFDDARPSTEYRFCVQELAEHGGGGAGKGGAATKRARATIDGAVAAAARPRSLGYWCFHSGHAMRQLTDSGVRSILLTSGTLSPLSSFADELGLPFPHQLESHHVINPERCARTSTPARGSQMHIPEASLAACQRRHGPTRPNANTPLYCPPALVPYLKPMRVRARCMHECYSNVGGVVFVHGCAGMGGRARVCVSSQLMVGVFPKGPSGHELTSAYAQRDVDASRRDLGNSLVNFARLIPHGMLVFFPSYAALQAAHTAWLRPTAEGGASVLERLQACGGPHGARTWEEMWPDDAGRRPRHMRCAPHQPRARALVHPPAGVSAAREDPRH